MRTTDEHAEAWADQQVSRRQATHQYHPLGVTNQGRHEHRAHPVEEAVTETKITDGAHASSELLEDECELATWWEDTRFMLACAAGSCALAFMGWLWRVQ
jgi:hypothetical protein